LAKTRLQVAQPLAVVGCKDRHFPDYDGAPINPKSGSKWRNNKETPSMESTHLTPATSPDIQHMSTFAEFYLFYLGEHSDLACRMNKDMWLGKVKVL
jgi:hypothetical protein